MIVVLRSSQVSFVFFSNLFFDNKFVTFDTWWLIYCCWILHHSGSTTKNAADNQSERKSITPSMFKNGTNPLNLNFKLPSPLGGASTLSSSTLNRKSTSTVNNSNSSGLKSNQSSANSTISSKSNSSFNSSANNIAKSLTLRSPTKSLISEKSTAAASTKSDRPTTKVGYCFGSILWNSSNK